MRSYIRDTEFQDPVTSEMKSLRTLRTVQDFWNWHEVFPKTGCVCARACWREHGQGHHQILRARGAFSVNNAGTRAYIRVHTHTLARTRPRCALSQVYTHARTSICCFQ